MSAETSREDPRHIFLEPECCADPSVGRCWAAHNEWPLDDCDVQAEATKYVRADLVAALERERDAATARAEAAEAVADQAVGRLEDLLAEGATLTAQRDAATAERDRLRAEVADLRESVVAFAAPWAGQWAKDHNLPHGHLHPVHYDILAKAGARMDDFTRAALTSAKEPSA